VVTEPGNQEGEGCSTEQSVATGEIGAVEHSRGTFRQMFFNTFMRLSEPTKAIDGAHRVPVTESGILSVFFPLCDTLRPCD